MRALLINAVCGIRSTGRICVDLANELESQGYEVKIAYGREEVPAEYLKYAVKIGDCVSVYWHALMGRFFDERGYWSKYATKKFIKWAEEYNPDLLWIHNIHDYFINLELLFDWIKTRPSMEVKWTQHDCWAFTGGCMHFVVNNCYQWENQCIVCPKGRNFVIKRQEKRNFLTKKELFTGVKNMTIVAVSNWTKKFLSKSFLGEYPIEVYYNKVNKLIFKPTYGEFRKEYHLENKKIVLGVASSWSLKKGLYDFVELSKHLDDSYKVVLVGLNKKQLKQIPLNILGIERTNSTCALAEIYTAADVYVNLSKEETFGMTTVEAISCGTIPIVYKDTACEEVVNMYGGVVVNQSLSEVLDAIKSLCEKE